MNEVFYQIKKLEQEKKKNELKILGIDRDQWFKRPLL